ncbi:MAG: hypothetical protein UZ05_CHB002001746 [Chlorobi bacterium OLB5]|nr:MAG: hypothetical protein UZ05_CHB002001746 [Chlorobi bacterium OLB5]
MKPKEAKKPKAGQESVWDYPRPPRIEDFSGHIKIIFNGEVIAETNRAKRVLETSHPPVYYIPPEDVKEEFLEPANNHSFCEWKGEASYYHLNVKGKQVRYACWYYPEPVKGFAELKYHMAFYAQKMDACFVNDEKVTPQPGKFYGGWITKNIVGPFKGEEGSEGW